VAPGAARLAAPIVFLLVVTVAVLLVRSAMQDDVEPAAATTRGSTTVAARTAPAVTPTRAATTAPSTARQEFYEIRAGDTLDAVASRFDITLETLFELNPGVDPMGLQVGQRIRVK
jgi:LysM repeat protein